MSLLFPIAHFLYKGIFTSEDGKIFYLGKILEGLTVAAISIGTIMIINNEYNPTDKMFTLLFITAIIVVMSTYNNSIFSITLIGTMSTFHFITNYNNELSLMEYIIFPIMWMSVPMIISSIKNKKNNEKLNNKFLASLIFFTLFVFYTMFSLLISLILKENNKLSSWEYYVNYIFAFLVMVFIQIQLLLIDKYYIHTLDLSKYSLFQYESFYRFSHVNKMIKDLMVETKRDDGLVIIFKIEFFEKEPEETTKLFLENIILEVGKISEDAIFFKSDSQDWSIFIPLEEKENQLSLKESLDANWTNTRAAGDILRPIESAFKKALTSAKIKNVNLKVGASIYGTHSYDIVDLLRKSEFMVMQQYNNQLLRNTILMYNHKKYKQVSQTNEKITEISYIINFDDIEIEFEERLVGKKKFLIPKTSYKSSLLFFDKFDDDIKLIKKKNLISYYNRMISLKILSEYKIQKKKHKLLLPYTLNHLNNKDEIEMLRNKISSLKIDFNKIIFSFDRDLINFEDSVIQTSLSLINEGKIEIAIFNLTEKTNIDNIIEVAKPKYLLFDIYSGLAKEIIIL